jgi:hypothetical protein
VKYVISQVVDCNDQYEAVIVGARRFGYNDNYGFPYSLGNQTVRPQFPVVDASILDKIVKKVVASVAIYYVAKSLKNWAKE